MHEYLIKMSLDVTVRIKAETEDQAIDDICDLIEEQKIEIGDIDDEPILGDSEIRMLNDEGHLDIHVVEVDGARCDVSAANGNEGSA